MCGILGYYNITNARVERSRDEVIALRDMMRHRGPDSEGYLEAPDQSWVLAHRRLSILDLSAHGHQPMSDPTGKIHICYNGEIYNFKDLRDELKKIGYAFVSTSDTEVILHLYKHLGLACFDRLLGMFALIIVDEEKKHAVIARDPVGKKPIYYAVLGGNVVIASDPGVISRDRHYRKAINMCGLYSVLTMGEAKSPDSLFEGIYKLEPGTYHVLNHAFDVAQPPVRFSSFELTSTVDLVDDNSAIDTLDGLLDRAVERRMISDVPFGVFLSGGIDSALILNYMSRHTPHVNTFSIDLATSDDQKRETSIATRLAESYKTNHHSVHISDAEYIEILDQVIFKNSTMAIPDSVLLAKLSELARQNGVIVIETGEGADELFLGYNDYLMALNHGYAKLNGPRRFIPRALARFACLFGSDAKKNRVSFIADSFDIGSSGGILHDFLYEPFFSYQSKRIVHRCYATTVPESKFHWLNDSIVSRVRDYAHYSPSTLSVVWNATFRWADFLLNRIDNFTMTSSVEGRAPFLDRDVINFGLSISDRLKVRNGTPKYILRKIAERHISKDYAGLPKRGFGGGNVNMLNERVCEYMRGKLASSHSYRENPLLGIDSVDNESQLFTLTSFHTWVDNWM